MQLYVKIIGLIVFRIDWLLNYGPLNKVDFVDQIKIQKRWEVTKPN